MATVSSCPKCSGRVMPPAHALKDVWVRCPICAAEYSLYRVVEQPVPELELIDEPAVPFEGRIPTWAAVAAAGAAPRSTFPVTELATPAGDFADEDATDVLAIPPISLKVDSVSSADVGDDSDVIHFDDSLLLDEPTDAMPGVGTASHAAVPPLPTAGDSLSDADFFNAISSDSAAEEQRQGAEMPNWIDDSDDTLEPFEPGGAESDEFRLAGNERQSDAFEPALSTTPASAPKFGLPPRRKSRGNPLATIAGYVGGGALGLAIGYGILMWGFGRDPFALASKLPEVLVPASLRPAAARQVAQDDGPMENVPSSPKEVPGEAADGNQELDKSLVPFGDPPSDPSGANDVSALPDDRATGQAANGTAADGFEPLPDSVIDPLAGSAKAADGGATDSAANRDPFGPAGTAAKDANVDASPTNRKSDPLTNPFGAPATNETKSGASDLLVNPFEDAATDAKADPSSDRSASKPEVQVDDDPLPAEAFGPVSAMRYSNLDLLAATAAARRTTQAALALPVNASAEQRKRTNGPYYRDLSRVAETFTFVEPTSDSAEDRKATNAAIEAFLNAAPNRARLEEIGKLAGYWFDNPQGKGIVLCGMVKDSRPQGQLVESVVEMLGTPVTRDAQPAKPAQITVISPSPLTDDPGRPVLVAGAIVNEPAANLRGYQGAAKTVVWAAMAIDPTDPPRNATAPQPAKFDERDGDDGKSSSPESSGGNRPAGAAK